ncbi:SDR family oxidoreductase [Nocardia seriolae]|uniref:Short-chain dehydrogenase n=1 Tax=Nocardia seriolae TaxID=37332 RepID=A0A0B8NQZ6_9NOCA|nr:SDR family oxidoreductase [Nocardia seriolae]MTJ63172.1 SDR family oxidoreductase [Nocardia seriolae]MTJ76219.1 SDR family oxidoreductase [Nocardia seriolae]MTJ89023.1 SDR family oxidoreductase [Nocardia seriolae]MTK33003.1 SDR family oxidoreductase [Nocardia seriolae]MTK41069.1 SDR family oxidoreductase [Nocardia seriolae]
MVSYIVTGGTGFLGRRVVAALLERDPEAVVHALTREASVAKLREMADGWGAGDRAFPLVGDLAAPGLGLADEAPQADHVIHLGAVYDMTADERVTYAANVQGTRSVIELALGLGATLHHVSSVAVAGDHKGKFFEDDFDLGQGLHSPYHRTKFEAEKMVREAEGLRWRVYRPAIVVGDSRTGEMDKIDGPYYFFPAIAGLGALPSELPMPIPDLGSTNIVPVDYVVEAMVELINKPGLVGRTFHLTNPEPQPFTEIYNALARAAGAPTAIGTVPGSHTALTALGGLPGVPAVRDFLLERLGIPPEVAPHTSFESTFVSESTRAQLRGTGIEVPAFEDYADTLWKYWRANLDPDRARRVEGDRLEGRVVLITGASTGIGLATAHAVARRGATVLMVARTEEDLELAAAQVRAESGAAQAYTCDITDEKSVELLVKQVLADHGHVDYVVNNAGRSLRRSVLNSTDRMHDFERTMAVNYFGAVRLILALLPSMRERRFGHFVNISSIAVQTKVPRFAAYVASKSALDNFSEIAAVENADAGITFTSVRMPLVRTAMIAPTDLYKSIPVHSPDQAADIVVRALEHRPSRIDTPIGTFAQFVDTVMPSVKRAILHQGFRMFGESKAARNEHPAPETAPDSDAPKSDSRSPLLALAPIVQPLMGLPAPAARITNRIPGLHW